MPRVLRNSSYVQPFLIASLFLLLMTVPRGQRAMWNAPRPAPGAGSTFTVNSTGDSPENDLSDGVCNDGSGACTLRAAIMQANFGAPSADVINFNLPPNSVITLNSSLEFIQDDVDINGPGTNTLTIQRSAAPGTPRFRIFVIPGQPINVNISGLTISNGHALDFPNGAVAGGILNQSGIVNLTGVAVIGNRSGDGTQSGGAGGGIYNSGTMTITNSTISGNATGAASNPDGVGGFGGGIYNAGTLALTNTTISGNTTGNGGVAVSGGYAGHGGGIANLVTVTMTNCTVSGNQTAGTTAPGYGGGIYNSGTVTLIDNTIAFNRTSDGVGPAVSDYGSGGGIYNQGTVNFKNSIIANNTVSAGAFGPDLYGTFNSLDFNLIRNPADATITGQTANNYGGINPLLGPLAANGGPTLTHALLVLSPAIDSGSSSQTQDQRGEPRPFDDVNIPPIPGSNASDRGAYEAHTFEVNSTADTNDGACTFTFVGNGCTLREAIADANAQAGSELITFDSSLTSGGPATITLQTALPNLSSNMTISGPGANLLTVKRSTAGGTPNFRIFTVTSGNGVTVSGLTISNGFVTAATAGGGLSVEAGTLSVLDCVVSGNGATSGAGIYNFGGVLTVNRSTISGNTATQGAGGGVFNDGGQLNLTNSTVSGNVCDAQGAGILNGGSSPAVANLTNVTIRGNGSTGTLGAAVGAIANSPGGHTVNLTNCTISINSVGGPGGQAGGVTNGGGSTVTSRNTIIADNTGGFGDLSGTFISRGHNLIGVSNGSNGFTNGVDGDQVGTFTAWLDPRLGHLVDNGGPTFTMALLPNSPAIDAGDDCVTNNTCVPAPGPIVNTDQRGAGFNRPADGNGDGTATVDIGAYEVQGFLVTNTNDDGAGSLRQAITDANATTGAVTITFQAGLTGTITLQTALPDLTSVSINGPGASLLTVQRSSAGGTPDFRIFTVGSGKTVAISGLTISNGRATGASGGGILNAGTLTLNSCTVSGNTASGDGGAIKNQGTLTVNNSTLAGNSGSSGGGIANVVISSDPFTTVIATINNSTISGNTAATGSGAGIFSGAGSGSSTAILIVYGSTISGNVNIGSPSGGGGIYNAAVFGNASATVTITNSTISGNSAGSGGGLFHASSGTGSTATATITNCTFSANNSGTESDSGGGILTSIFESVTNTVLRNTIVAGNRRNGGAIASDVSGAVDSSSSFNLIGDGTGLTGISNGAGGNQIGTSLAPINARLGALANNGGPVLTHALLSGSPALDAGNNSPVVFPPFIGPPFTDQRGTGFSRIRDAADANTTQTVDIGAFEADPSVEDITDKTVAEEGSLSFSFNVADSATAFDSITATSSNTLLVPNAPGNLNVTGSGATRTLGIVPAAGGSGTTTITVTATKTISGTPVSMSDTFVLTVSPVADTPSVTNATANEDSVNTSGLVITRNAADGAEVTHFKITSITNGTLFKNDGVTQINNGDFILAAEGGAGLRFRPSADSFAAGSFNVQAAVGNTDAGLGGGVVTATITVTPVADTPSVTNATTLINTQSSSGLVITRNAVDGAEVTHFRIEGILNGTLYKNDGVTQIPSFGFITVAEGNAGLKFTPATNLMSPASTFRFSVRGVTGTSGIGTGISNSATATITVNCNAGAVVTNTNDSGPGSLRAAILQTCGGSTITFNIPTSDPGFSNGVYTISLTSGELPISRSLTITGPGAQVLTVRRADAAPNFRIFNISQDLTVRLSGLTIANGLTAVSTDNNGGGIYNRAALTLSDVAVTGNRTSDGTPNHSGGYGGGIYNFSGALSLTNSTVSNNRTGNGGSNDRGGFGGGIYARAGSPLTLTNSTVSGNQTGSGTEAGGGAGLSIEEGGTITNSTIANNQTGNAGFGNGGGILNSGSSTLTVNDSTIANNASTLGSGGGIHGGIVFLRNSIIANNTCGASGTGPDLNGSFHSADYNLIGNTSGASFTDNTTHNIVNQNPNLGPLASHGGPTQTMLPLPGSPAINAGAPANLPPDTYDLDADGNTTESLPLDQRGFTRVVSTNFDIGAVETNYTVAATAGTPQSATINTAFATALQATVSESNLVQNAVTVTFTAPATGASGTFAGGATTATVTTNASGVATAPVFTANASAGGPYNVVAGIGAGLPSANFSLTNSPAPTVTTVSSSPNPVGLGSIVTFSATVTSGAGIPTGSVVFKADGAALTSSKPLNAAGVATASVAFLVAGSHTISADYSGDANFAASSGTLPTPQLITDRITINDVSVTEGDSGTSTANFTVTLAAESNIEVKVNFATANGSATAGSDYQAKSGTVTFSPGQTTQPVSITVNGDTAFEANETFVVNLSTPVNATITDAQGTGTIGNDDPQGGTLVFSSATYTTAETAGSVLITVNRSGDTTQAVAVDYATADLTTDGRRDYTPASGTLQFGVGVASQTFPVLVNVDAFAEGSELVQLTLSNPTNTAVLGVPSSATLQIDNSVWTPPPANSIDDASAFVRQHYHDFLNREPDAAGLAFWTNQITECQQPGATCSADVRRINVSAAFFLSIEFQETGYLVYRFYKSAYANIPGTPVPVRLAEFLPDTQQIGKGVQVGVGDWQTLLENNKIAFALAFVSRARFTTAFPTTLSPAQFVDALFTNAGVTPSTAERDAAIAEFGGAGNTANTAARARALRRVAENSALKQQETNRAFVLMQYFGYLRRNPNDAPEANLNFDGYNFWLGKLNEFNGNFVNAEMVKAFIVSGEYRQRFGP